MSPDDAVQTERQKINRLIFDLATALEEHANHISPGIYELSVNLIEDATRLRDHQRDQLAYLQRMSNALASVYTQLLLEIAIQRNHEICPENNPENNPN